MGLDPELEALMPHKVRIRRRVGRDKYGEDSYGVMVEYPARVVNKIRRVRDPNGEERISTANATIATAEAISPFDQITLPDETSPPILAVETFPDEAGGHHTVVYT